MADKDKSARSIVLLHGPNLSRLGIREPEIYGEISLGEINRHIEEMALLSGWTVKVLQSNHEGVLIDEIENAEGFAEAIIINPGGLSHTSVSLRDAISASPLKVIEVHLSNISGREDFRQTSLVSAVCDGTISGFGMHSYLMALWYLLSSDED